MPKYTVTLWSHKQGGHWDESSTEEVEARTPREAVLDYPYPNDDRRRVRVLGSGVHVEFVTGLERYAEWTGAKPLKAENDD
jgi:hypothetical protein